MTIGLNVTSTVLSCIEPHLTHVEQVCMHRTLEDHNLDYLDIIEIIVDLESSLCIDNIDLHEVSSRSINDIISILEEKLSLIDVDYKSQTL